MEKLIFRKLENFVRVRRIFVSLWYNNMAAEFLKYSLIFLQLFLLGSKIQKIPELHPRFREIERKKCKWRRSAAPADI